MNIHEIPNTIYHNLDFIILNVVFNLIHSDRKMPQPKKPKTEFVPLPDQDVGVVMDAFFIAKELPVSNMLAWTRSWSPLPQPVSALPQPVSALPQPLSALPGPWSASKQTN